MVILMDSDDELLAAKTTVPQKNVKTAAAKAASGKNSKTKV